MHAWMKFLKILPGKPLESSYKSVNVLLDYLQNEKSNSSSSIATYCKILHCFCKFTNQNPDELVAMDPERLEKLIKTFAEKQRFEDNFTRRSTANGYVKSLKTFFDRNNKKGVKYPHYYVPSRRAPNMYIPTLREVEKTAACAGSLRDRAIILVLSSTGYRNSTLRALKYNEHPTQRDGSPLTYLYNYTIKTQLEQKFDNILIAVYPGMKRNIPSACKGNVYYFTFTSKEATEAIIEYLEERIRKCGKIEDDEYLFPTIHRGYRKEDRNRTPMNEKTLERIVKVASRRAGIKLWKHVTPTSLRKTYNRTLKDQISFEDKEFFMGHILPGTSEDYFDPTKVEEMRDIYSQLVFSDNSETALERRKKRELIKSYEEAGIPAEDILRRMTRDLDRSPTFSELQEALLKEAIEMGYNNRRAQERAISEEDLVAYA